MALPSAVRTYARTILAPAYMMLAIVSITGCAHTGVKAALLPNLVTQIDGQAEIRRTGRAEFVPIAIGTEVNPGDVLRFRSGKMAVFCGDEDLWDKDPVVLTGGEVHGVPCLAGNPPRSALDLSPFRGSKVNDAEPQTSVIYALSPRTGFVLTDRPVLNWHAPSSGGAYSVTLQSNDDMNRPPKVIVTNELAFPPDWPPLQANGAAYNLVVYSTRSDVQTLHEEGVGFVLLEPKKADQLRRQVEHLRQRPLGEPALAILTAVLYTRNEYRLRSDAVEVLQSIEGGDGLPAVQRLLGHLYLEMGLVEEGRSAFERTKTLGQVDGLPEFEADGWQGLGIAQCQMRQIDEAIHSWTSARALYLRLGSTDLVAGIDQLLARSSSECENPTLSK